jgi:folate-dependent phosphoribosylglycinamide formyltransferase PurN
MNNQVNSGGGSKGSVMQQSNASAVFLGDGLLLAACAEEWIANGHHVVEVITRSPQIRAWAQSLDLTCRHTDEVDAPASCDLFASVANLTVLGPQFAASARTLAINFHDGPLPDVKGRNVAMWSLITGREVHGITWHELTERVDGGRIVATESFAVSPQDTALSINEKCFSAGVRTFATIATGWADESWTLSPQPAGTSTVYLRRSRPSPTIVGAIESATALDRLLRGLETSDRQDNELGRVRLIHDDDVVVVRYAPDAIARWETPDGQPLTVGVEVLAALSTAVDQTRDVRVDASEPMVQLSAALTAIEPQLAMAEPAWRAALVRARDFALDWSTNADGSATERTSKTIAASGVTLGEVAGALGLALTQQRDIAGSVISVIDAHSASVMAATGPLLAPPFVTIDATATTVGEVRTAVHEQLAAGADGPWLRDLVGRTADLRARMAVPVQIVVRAPGALPSWIERATVIDVVVHDDHLAIEAPLAESLGVRIAAALAVDSSAALDEMVLITAPLRRPPPTCSPLCTNGRGLIRRCLTAMVRGRLVS